MMQLKDLLLKKLDRQVPHKSVMLRLIFCFVNAFLLAACDKKETTGEAEKRAEHGTFPYCPAIKLQAYMNKPEHAAFMRRSTVLTHQKITPFSSSLA